jgi:hypothetical protein
MSTAEPSPTEATAQPAEAAAAASPAAQTAEAGVATSETSAPAHDTNAPPAAGDPPGGVGSSAGLAAASASGQSGQNETGATAGSPSSTSAPPNSSAAPADPESQLLAMRQIVTGRLGITPAQATHRITHLLANLSAMRKYTTAEARAELLDLPEFLLAALAATSPAESVRVLAPAGTKPGTIKPATV